MHLAWSEIICNGNPAKTTFVSLLLVVIILKNICELIKTHQTEKWQLLFRAHEFILMLYLPLLQWSDLRWFESKHQFSSSSQVDCKASGVQKVNWPRANVHTTASQLGYLITASLFERRKLALFFLKTGECLQLSVNYAERCQLSLASLPSLALACCLFSLSQNKASKYMYVYVNLLKCNTITMSTKNSCFYLAISYPKLMSWTPLFHPHHHRLFTTPTAAAASRNSALGACVVLLFTSLGLCH